ncbi:hypothetical protein, partial [Candidatus Macondimonas diazotrophica]
MKLAPDLLMSVIAHVDESGEKIELEIRPKKRRVESRFHPFSGELYELDITPPEIEVKLSLDDAQRLADTLWTCGIHPR